MCITINKEKQDFLRLLPIAGFFFVPPGGSLLRTSGGGNCLDRTSAGGNCLGLTSAGGNCLDLKSPVLVLILSLDDEVDKLLFGPDCLCFRSCDCLEESSDEDEFLCRVSSICVFWDFIPGKIEIELQSS